MPKRDPARKTISVRVTKTTAERMRNFLRDYCGKPLYLKPGDFVEKAILREIERLELVLAGALPMDEGRNWATSASPGSKVKSVRANNNRTIGMGLDDRNR